MALRAFDSIVGIRSRQMVLVGSYATSARLTVTIEVQWRGCLQHACILFYCATSITVTGRTFVGLNGRLVVSIEAACEQKRLSRRYDERAHDLPEMLAFNWHGNTCTWRHESSASCANRWGEGYPRCRRLGGIECNWWRGRDHGRPCTIVGPFVLLDRGNQASPSHGTSNRVDADWPHPNAVNSRPG